MLLPNFKLKQNAIVCSYRHHWQSLLCCARPARRCSWLSCRRLFVVALSRAYAGCCSLCNIKFSWNMLLNLSALSASTICLPYQQNITIIYSLTYAIAFIHSFAFSWDVVSRIYWIASWIPVNSANCILDSCAVNCERWSTQHFVMRDGVHGTYS